MCCNACFDGEEVAANLGPGQDLITRVAKVVGKQSYCRVGLHNNWKTLC